LVKIRIGENNKKEELIKMKKLKKYNKKRKELIKTRVKF